MATSALSRRFLTVTQVRVDHQSLAWLDDAARAQIVPAEEIVETDAETICDTGGRIDGSAGT